MSSVEAPQAVCALLFFFIYFLKDSFENWPLFCTTSKSKKEETKEINNLQNATMLIQLCSDDMVI